MLEMIPVTRAPAWEVEISQDAANLKGIMHQGFQLDLMNNLFRCSQLGGFSSVSRSSAWLSPAVWP